MEKAREWNQMTLINELNQGKELANQLRNHLNPSSSQEKCIFLIDKIIFSYDKALAMVKWGDFVGESRPTAAAMFNSLHSIGGSDQDCNHQSRKDVFKKRKKSRTENVHDSDRDREDQSHEDVFKQRNKLPEWTEKGPVCTQKGPEEHHDGYRWRKYGKKLTNGAKFPKSYYRCAYHHCVARKQVQISDENSLIMETNYRGRHNCAQASQFIGASSASQEIQEEPKHQQQEQQEKQKQTTQMYESFSFGNIGFKSGEQIFPSAPFPSTPIGSENVEDRIFSRTVTENNSMGSFSPAYLSPATSECNSVSVTCQMNNFGMGHNLPTSESDLNEPFSATTSVTNSPIQDFDFSHGAVNLGSNYPFDPWDFFSRFG